MTDIISYDDFEKVDIRVGRIIEVAPFERARNPSYKLKIDFGPEIGIKQSSAQLARRYRPDELVDTLCIAVVNFAPKNIAGFQSEVLVLGVDTDTGVTLLRPDAGATIGARMF